MVSRDCTSNAEGFFIMITKRDSFIFYRSFYEALQDLPNQQKLEIYDAICNFSLNFHECELKGISSTIFKLIKPQLEANNKRFMNGSKPKKSKMQAKLKQVKSKNEANNNVNNNVNVNVNDNTLYYNSERDFLADWKKAREAILKLPTNIKKLNLEESRIFQEVKNNYSIDYFRSAMQGLFVQENVYDYNKLRPTHFFKDRNFEQYKDCFVNKTQLFEDKKNNKQQPEQKKDASEILKEKYGIGL